MRPFRFALACALFAAMSAAAANYDVWLVDSLIKVFPDTQPAKRSAPEVHLARNGHAAIQVALRSAAEIRDVNVTVEIAGRPVAAKLHLVGYVPVTSHAKDMPVSELVRPEVGPHPDPLLPYARFSLPAGETKAVWVTLHAPVNATPGAGRGRVVVSAQGVPRKTLDFDVNVARAVVPAERNLLVTNWFYVDQAAMARQFPSVKDDREQYWRLLGNMGRVLADYRQNVILTPIRELVKPVVEGGRIRYDFAEFDRWVETFQKAGLLGTIEGGHLLGRVSGYQTPLVVPSNVIEDGRAVLKQLQADDPRAREDMRAFLQALHAHLKQRGWAGRYIQHLHDEPHDGELPIYAEYAKLVKSAMPGVPIIDAISLEEDRKWFTGTTDIWVPLLGTYEKKADAIQEHKARGGQSWFYTCVFPQKSFLNRFIDQPSIKTRLLHWLNYRENFTGYLHWGGNYWPERPFDEVQPVINDGTLKLPAGDNTITYPDPERLSILPSIRLEMMRQGIEDYELLRALGERDKAAAQRIATQAVRTGTDYVRDVSQFRKIERELLEAAGK